MADPCEFEEEELVEICDSEGKRSAMRLLAMLSFGGKNYFVLGNILETEDHAERSLLLVREDETIDGAQKYVITEDEQEIDSVIGRFVMQSVMRMIDAIDLDDSEETDCPCGMKHRIGEFCFCDRTDYLQ